MASTIILSDNGASSGSAGLKSTAGNDGVLILQTTTSGGTATNAVYIDNTQQVGIGVTPSSKLHVGGIAYFGTTSATDTQLRLGPLNSSNTYLQAVSADGSTAKGYAFYTGSTQAMTLDASGNLLVGGTSVTNPAGWSKGIQVYNANYPYLSIKNNTRQYDFAGYGGDLYLWDATAGAARMVIDSSGRLLVGTTSTEATGGPATSTATTTGLGYFKSDKNTLIANCTNSGGSYEPLAVMRQNSTGNLVTFWYGLSAQTGNITTNGTTTAYNTSSDYRLKQNIAPMTGALEKIAALKPCTYTWKVDDSDGEGFIAHELAEVCPQAVTGEKDAVDEEGNPKYQGIDTSFLVATLTAAIQEQQTQIADQLAIITTLTSRIEALEGK